MGTTDEQMTDGPGNRGAREGQCGASNCTQPATKRARGHTTPPPARTSRLVRRIDVVQEAVHDVCVHEAELAVAEDLRQRADDLEAEALPELDRARVRAHDE